LISFLLICALALNRLGIHILVIISLVNAMELTADAQSEEESSINVSNNDTDEAGSTSVPVDDEGFETLAAEIREVLAELAQVTLIL
jgi:hypothetical protein